MSDFDEKAHPVQDARPIENSVTLLGQESPGVQRIKATAAHITFTNRIFLFLSIFLVAFAYSLDGTLRYSFQPTATSSLGSHSELAVLNTIRAIIAAATQITGAKIADVFGRVEVLFVSIFFYTIGTVIEASAQNTNALIAGAAVYQIGYNCIILLAEVIIADTTSLRSRVFFSYIPALPFLINTWVSGDVNEAVLRVTTWRWGFGMWAIIYPVCALPLLLSLLWVTRKAKRAGALDNYRTPRQIYGGKRLLVALFWQLDVVGIFFLVLGFGLILVPFAAAKGGLSEGNSTTWGTAKIIVPLVLGVLCIPAWIVWERRAPHPMVPFHLIKDRAVWAALGIACFLNFAWAVQGDFLYTVLVVAFNESVKSALRISSLYSFASVICGTLIGLVIFRVRRLKPFIMFGTCLFMVAFGLLMHYRGGESSHSGIVGAQILLGIAGGLFPYPAQASIQAATKHEHVAAITAIYLATYNIGSALGNTVSGAVWGQTVPPELERNLNNATEVDLWFRQPLVLVAEYPVGTPQRAAVIDSYKEVQWLLCLIGLCLCIPLIFFSCLLRNPRLGDEQSLPDAEMDPKKRREVQGTEGKKGLFAFLKR